MKRCTVSRNIPSTLIAPVALLAALISWSAIAEAQGISFSFPDGDAVLINEAPPQQQQNSFNYMLRLFQDKNIQTELEIVEAQSREIKQIAEDKFQAGRKLSQSAPSWSPETASDPVFKELAKQAQVLELQALERISAVLLPHQSEKLNSVVSWIAVSKYGLLVLADQVAEQLEVTPTAEQRKAIQDTQEKLDREFHEYCLREYRSLISRISDKFPMYREYTEQLDESATMAWIDFLLADDQNLEDLSPDILGSTLADLVKGVRHAHVTANGNWKTAREEEPAINEMMNLLYHKSGDAGGLINQDQKEAFGALFGEKYFKQSHRAHEKFEEQRANGVGIDEAGRDYQKAMQQIDQQAMQHLQEEILLPAQTEWLSQSLRHRKMNSYGIAGVLLIETDADGASISAEDRTKAREFLKTEVQTLKKNITHEFHETVRRQVARLPDSIKGDTRRLLDHPPGYLLPNLSLLASRIPAPETQRIPTPAR